MKNKLIILLGVLLLAVISGCDKKPMNKFVNPSSDAALGLWSGTWLIYGDNLNTGGGFSLFTSLDNCTLDYQSPDYAYSGKYSLKYAWNGGKVFDYGSGGYEGYYTGVSFIAGADYQHNYPRDISPGKYTKFSFWAKGTLNQGVSVTITGPDGTSAQYTGGSLAQWTHFNGTLANPAKLNNVTEFFSIIFGYDSKLNAGADTGSGGVIYLDDIQLTR